MTLTCAFIAGTFKCESQLQMPGSRVYSSAKSARNLGLTQSRHHHLRQSHHMLATPTVPCGLQYVKRASRANTSSGKG